MVIKMYDVIIVGAGPAGLFSAYELIKKNKNLKILLIDKGKFAKKRCCPIAENKKEFEFSLKIKIQIIYLLILAYKIYSDYKNFTLKENYDERK